MVSQVGQAVEDWQPLDQTVAQLADAPDFEHLEHFDSWHGANVNRTYLQLEGE